MRKKIIMGLVAVAIMATALGLFIKSTTKKSCDVKTFTAFFFSTGVELDSDNEIMELIAEKTGARCIETWGDGSNGETVINNYIAEGEYPDFIVGGANLVEANALIPIDEYLDDYPNIKNYLSKGQWDALRQADGHIYWIPQFGVFKYGNTDFFHSGEAFWVQQRVLAWANYPDIRTVDEYFDLLEAYTAANPYMEDGVTENIPFTVLCDDWRIFCLENVPQFLDGYPNDGCCMVNPETLEVMDYNTTPTAKKYFKKLNEEYKKGIFDPESFTSTYQEYLDKLSTGAVLGMVDQRWQFYYGTKDAYANNNLADLGCEYVPLPITISRDVKNQYHETIESEFDSSSGLSITVSCKDVRGAFQFVNDLLDDEVADLRAWGVKDLDYCIDEDGLYYLSEEQNGRTNDPTLQRKHFCSYPYFPRYEGMKKDGKNAYIQEYQESEFLKTLSPQIRECFEAYGVKNYVELLGSNEKPGDWYPMYSYSDLFTYSTPEGTAFNDAQYVKHQWLPVVIMAEDFETSWNEYMKAYSDCNPKLFLDSMQEEVYRRIEAAKDED